jgi:outer membrane protein assembly factor BamD
MKMGLMAACAAACAMLLLQGCAAEVRLNKPTEELMRDGESSFQKGKYADAVAQWRRIKESFPPPELSAKVEINIADAYFLNKEYIEASAEYENFRKLHPNHELAGYALYGQGLSNFSQIKDIDTDQTPLKNSLSLFESYARLYPAGASILQVQERIRACRDKQLQYELYVGTFYLRTGHYPAAIARLEEALKGFGDLPRSDETLFYLASAYVESGQKPKGQEVYARLLKEHASSVYVPKAKKAMAAL